MINFFRRIRKKMADDNRPLKYMRYAIGEIVLVVIGILIALQINNWNEERKDKEKTSRLLKEAHKELVYNIKQSSSVIDYYRKKDSLLWKVIHKQVTYEDYKTNWELRVLVTGDRPANLTSDAFNNLIDNEGSLTQQEDSIVLKLKKLFATRKRLVDEHDIKTVSNIDRHMEKLKNEKVWYSQLMLVPDEQIDFFLNDPFYLNEVKHFEIYALQTHLMAVKDFKVDATSIYEKLSDYLDLKKDTSIVKDLNDYDHYLGTFEIDSLYNAKIERENNSLSWNFIAKNDTTILHSIPIYPDSKTYFTAYAFGKFIYDDSDNVTGIIVSNGSERFEYKKIN